MPLYLFYYFSDANKKGKGKSGTGKKGNGKTGNNWKKYTKYLKDKSLLLYRM